MKDFIAKIHRRIHDYEGRRAEPRFGAIGLGSVVEAPQARLLNPDRLFIGATTHIHPYCRIEIITENPHLEGPPLPATDARIEIGDRVVINSFTHLGAMSRIVLGNDVGIASGVCIEDHHYEYEQVSDDKPLKKQPFRVAEVVIEDGAMIGEHVTILPGVRIGRNSWIGANAVVTTDIPAYSIAAGVPARVLRSREQGSGAWRRTE